MSEQLTFASNVLVHLCADLPEVIERYKVHKDYRFYVEAPVWNREMLHRYWLKATGTTQTNEGDR